MRYHKMSDIPDTVVCTPAYFKHYEEAIKKHYPGFEIVADEFVPEGNAYLFNKAELTKAFEAKIERIN